MSTHGERVPGAVLLHPIAVAALLIWLINDHVLKTLTPGWITGKLSDVACLIVCPLLVVAAAELRWPTLPWQTQRWIVLAALALFGAIMSSIRVWPWAADVSSTRTRKCSSAARAVRLRSTLNCWLVGALRP